MSATYRRSAATMSADVGDDVVALHADNGFAYGMEEVTATVWRMLDEPRDLDTLVTRLTNEYDVEEAECRAEVTALLEQMTSEGLVEQVR
ncbi:PqqD family protein [Sphingomonas glaciei]|uniref:PqqD family protein n=1 Tax=Sphingomonas glaciei TaxID=2938948 RepID=A0ABY5MWC1_9SPHN|nr:PqqD family protein [Sphingomonas glaciei]UUR08754.1 PqqD family protein [Sphingomonas glaciei]